MAESTTFGDYIRELRVKQGNGLREAARLLSISPGYLSRLEANEVRPPSGEKLHRMARMFQVPIHRLTELASERAGEAMTSDQTTGPAVQAFYRLAQDQTPDNQEKMLRGAIDALMLPEDQKQQLMQNLKAALSRSHGKDLPRRAKGQDGLFAFDVKPRILSAIHLQSIADRVLAHSFPTAVPTPVPIEEIIDSLGPEIQMIIAEDIEGGVLRDGTPAVLGLSRWSRNGERRELVIHQELFEADGTASKRLCRFTLAHELFHCLEHLSLVKDRSADCALKRQAMFVSLAPQLASHRWYDRKRTKRTLSSNEDWREWQANTFASALLMPSAQLRKAFEFAVGTDHVDADDGRSAERVADEIAREPFIDETGSLTSLVEQFDVNPQAMAIRFLTLGLVSAA